MMILLTKAFLYNRFSYSNRILIPFSQKEWKKRIRLANSQCKEEKVIRFREKAEKSETTNDDFVNETFPSLSL